MDPHAASSSARARPLVWPWVVGAVLLIGLLVLYPPVRVVRTPVAGSAPGAAAASFSATAFVETFWLKRLQPAARQVPELAPFLVAVRTDRRAAMAAFSQRGGLGGADRVFLRGSGRVVAVERNRVVLDVEGHQVALETGPVFGNVVRDGCGLLEVNEVPGLAEFNEVSAAINRVVEERIQPMIRSGAKVGALLSFAGCAEVPEVLPGPPAPVLLLVPVWAEAKP